MQQDNNSIEVFFKRNYIPSILIDIEDFHLLKKYNWCPAYSKSYTNNVYLRTCINKQRVTLHRLLVGNNSSDYVDHINGNVRDNRKSNLRVCSKQQNTFNRRKSSVKFSSQFKGVHFRDEQNKWRASIRYNGKLYHLGQFKSERDAAMAYDKKAKEFFGEFAYINFPEVINQNKEERS